MIIMHFVGFFTWCDEAELRLNITRTKEMVIDVGKKCSKPVFIQDKDVDRVEVFWNHFGYNPKVSAK